MTMLPPKIKKLPNLRKNKPSTPKMKPVQIKTPPNVVNG